MRRAIYIILLLGAFPSIVAAFNTLPFYVYAAVDDEDNNKFWYMIYKAKETDNASLVFLINPNPESCNITATPKDDPPNKADSTLVYDPDSKEEPRASSLPLGKIPAFFGTLSAAMLQQEGNSQSLKHTTCSRMLWTDLIGHFKQQAKQ